jgi:hypothetical protein
MNRSVWSRNGFVCLIITLLFNCLNRHFNDHGVKLLQRNVGYNTFLIYMENMIPFMRRNLEWKHNIKIDLKKMWYCDVFYILTQDRNHWFLSTGQCIFEFYKRSRSK